MWTVPLDKARPGKCRTCLAALQHARELGAPYILVHMEGRSKHLSVPSMTAVERRTVSFEEFYSLAIMLSYVARAVPKGGESDV